jgi:hypothetical protein
MGNIFNIIGLVVEAVKIAPEIITDIREIIALLHPVQGKAQIRTELQGVKDRLKASAPSDDIEASIR